MLQEWGIGAHVGGAGIIMAGLERSGTCFLLGDGCECRNPTRPGSVAGACCSSIAVTLGLYSPYMDLSTGRVAIEYLFIHGYICCCLRDIAGIVASKHIKDTPPQKWGKCPPHGVVRLDTGEVMHHPQECRRAQAEPLLLTRH